MTRKQGQVRLGLEVLEDRMVLSTMGVLPGGLMVPAPSGLTLPSTLASPSQLPGATTTAPNGQGQIIRMNPGSNGQLPAAGQLPGTTTTGANGQEQILVMKSGTVGSKGHEQIVTKSGSNGQLPGFDQLPGTTTTGANGQRSTGLNGQQPVSTTGANGQERVFHMKSGTHGSKDHEQVVTSSGANGQQPGLITSDRILIEIGQKAF
jgi:hypothetical protein